MSRIRRSLAVMASALVVATTAFAEESPFRASRGQLAPPPAERAGAPVPPEGVAAGGLNFGAWRGAVSERYQALFQASVQALEAQAERGIWAQR